MTQIADSDGGSVSRPLGLSKRPDLIERQATGNQDIVVTVRVEVHRQPDLLQVAGTLDRPPLLAGCGQRRQQQRNQHRDDRHHHQKLDQRKG